ncbi:MAG: methyltransferase domain-containing protein, partial [Treponema sp.]|nr:methyltransferase domain-containing protein [Treponema sp.]
NAGIIITDLCPTVVKEWKKFLDKNNNIKNIKYAALNICDIPFKDETCDIISGYGAFINIEGDKFKALKEIYRVIKHGGMFVTDHIYVTKEYVETLPVVAYKTLRERFPSIFMDFYQETLEAGFKEIEETAAGEWSNENDESTLASLCRELGIHLVFSTFFRYCHK